MNFNVSILSAFSIAILCVLFPVLAVNFGLNYLIGVVIPYASLSVFISGFIFKVVYWGKSAVPFCITTTCGQEKSLSWIKYDRLESPFTKIDVFYRMLSEIFLFRSLFRNNKVYLYNDIPKVAYFSSKWLWLFAILFHYSFLVVLIRHLRYFTYSVPHFVHFVEKVDSFFEVGMPIVYLSGLVLFIAVLVLLLRRIVIDKLRYISLPSDYLPLFIILTIAITGIIMRYFYRIDVVAVKELAMGLVTFHPLIPYEPINVFFYIHLFSVCLLFIYLPFSKIIHMAGIFLTPTRNMANNSRAVRHVNPWNPDVKVHTYEEYEEEYRDKMKKAGLPVEKE